MFTTSNSGLPMFTTVYTFVFPYLPMFTRDYLCLHFLPMITPVYLCLPMITRVYLCIPCLHVHVDLFLPTTLVFTYDYTCLPMFTPVFLSLPMFICVYLC